MLKGLQAGPRAVKLGVKAGMAGATRMADCLVPRTVSKDKELLVRPDEVEADGLVTLVIALSQVRRALGAWGGTGVGMGSLICVGALPALHVEAPIDTRCLLSGHSMQMSDPGRAAVRTVHSGHLPAAEAARPPDGSGPKVPSHALGRHHPGGLGEACFATRIGQAGVGEHALACTRVPPGLQMHIAATARFFLKGLPG